MSELLVYPYSFEHDCIITYSSMINNFETITCVCLEGTLENEKKALGQLKSTITLTSNFKEALKSCDSVLILDTFFPERKDIYLENIRLAVEFNKKVLINEAICKMYQNEEELSGNLSVLENKPLLQVRLDDLREEKIQQPSIPVITVSSLGENCRKFEAQLELRRKFMSKGYKVLQFGTRDYADIFGFEKLPSFLYENNISFSDKVYLFNWYINQKVMEEEYDAVILGIPASIIPFNDMETCFFGELGLVISAALNIDINVCCVYHNEGLDTEQIQKWKDLFYYRMNCITDYFLMSDRQCRFSFEDKIFHMALDKEYCMNTIPSVEQEDFYLCHFLQEQKKDDLLEAVIEELADNIAVV